MVKRLKLRMTDGQKHVEFETDLSTVTYQIVHDTTEMLGPDVLAEHENTWVPLKDFPEAPWLDELATCAVEALRSGDIDACEGAAERVLCFAGSRECEAVCIAHLLQGHFRFVEGRLYEAISNWELAARSRSQVKSVACSNLGAAFALARNPVSALESLDRAIAVSPGFFAAHLSRRNLAETLIKEGAPRLPGQESWTKVLKEAADRVRRSRKADICEITSPDGPFPTYHVMHIFEPGPYCPAISSQLTCQDVETPGARSILDAASKAFCEAKYELALQLSRRAGEISSVVKPAADALSAVAEAKVKEARCLKDASRFVEASTGFFDSLCAIEADRDAPREFLLLLEAHQADVDQYRRLYRERMTDLILEQLSDCSGGAERAWLLKLASLFGEEKLSNAHARASAMHRARPFLNDFWMGCDQRDVTTAATALDEAEKHVGTKLVELHRVLDSLRAMCSWPEGAGTTLNTEGSEVRVCDTSPKERSG